MDEAAAARLLPERDVRGHKGTFGRVLVVAGSLDYAGAALMAGSAALRAGSGLVTLCLPASLQPLLAGRVPEIITRALPETAPYEVDGPAAAATIAESPAEALLVGPGLRPGRGTTRLTEALLAADGPPAVVDAGALDALSRVPRWWSRLGRPVIVTPHPGEFARLDHEVAADDEARAEAAARAARAWGVTVVLKGAHTVVATADELTSLPFEVPALATAGSGDILAGVIASLVGQGLAPHQAALLGVYIHGLAGQWLAERLGDAGVLATDLLTTVPRVRRHLVHERDRAGRLGFEAPER
jgi:hydroxyethylthiazole kinase-like uncharacterized protein yjeF